MAKINIAIGRLCGSNGHDVAEKLAKELGITLYDRQIICLMAEKLGMESENLDDVQTVLNSYEYRSTQVASPYSYMSPGLIRDYSDAKVYVEQSRIISQLAEEGSGIFLGRCANVVLKDLPDAYSFFLYADEDYRLTEAKKEYGIETLKQLKKRDKQRDEYYKRFTGFKRGDPAQYDMVINVGRLGVEKTVNLIKLYVTDAIE